MAHNGTHQGYRIIGGRSVFFRSGWEANVARILTLQNREWQYEPTTFWFESIKRGTTSYKPDFFLPQENKYIEVKGRWDKRSLTKKKRMAKYHPNVVIEYIDEPVYYKLRDQYKALIDEWEGR
jgi:hypothetical protein